MDSPDAVRADSALIELLAKLTASLDGRLAVVSGRSIEQIDAILGEASYDLAISGSHGCEHRWKGVLAQPTRPKSLSHAVGRFKEFANGHQGLLVEDKSFGVALHYRLNPAMEDRARSLAEAVAAEFDLHLQTGKMMVEVRVAGGDKGRAVHLMMNRPPMRGTTPIFIGDDATDEPGFAAARELGGHGILVGERRVTTADFAVGSPAELRAWLAEATR